MLSDRPEAVTRTPGRRNDQRARGLPGYRAFLVHRLSGLALALFLPLHFWALGTSLQGAAALDAFVQWTATPLFKFAEWGLVVLLGAHLSGGIRLLLIEFGRWQGLRKGLITLGLVLNLMLAALLTLVMIS